MPLSGGPARGRAPGKQQMPRGQSQDMYANDEFNPQAPGAGSKLPHRRPGQEFAPQTERQIRDQRGASNTIRGNNDLGDAGMWANTPGCPYTGDYDDPHGYPAFDNKLPYGSSQQFSGKTARQYQEAQRQTDQRVQANQRNNPSLHGSGLAIGAGPSYSTNSQGQSSHGGLDDRSGQFDRSNMNYGTEPALPKSDSRLPYRKPGGFFSSKTERSIKDVRGSKH